MTFVDEPSSEVALRPPSEYGGIGLFNSLDRGAIGSDDAFAAIRPVGETARWRTRPATTRRFASGHHTELLPPRDGRPGSGPHAVERDAIRTEG